MNKHILLVMKWLNDKDSVSEEELEENKKYASNAVIDAANAANAANAADASCYAVYACADVDYKAGYAEDWVNHYFKYSGDDPEEYEAKLKEDDK